MATNRNTRRSSLPIVVSSTSGASSMALPPHDNSSTSPNSAGKQHPDTDTKYSDIKRKYFTRLNLGVPPIATSTNASKPHAVDMGIPASSSLPNQTRWLRQKQGKQNRMRSGSSASGDAASDSPPIDIPPVAARAIPKPSSRAQPAKGSVIPSFVPNYTPPTNTPADWELQIQSAASASPSEDAKHASSSSVNHFDADFVSPVLAPSVAPSASPTVRPLSSHSRRPNTAGSREVSELDLSLDEDASNDYFEDSRTEESGKNFEDYFRPMSSEQGLR